MKVIFLDVDGVLNSDRTLYEYCSIEDDLLLNLKELVDRTQAKIVLSSSWRLLPNAMSDLMDKLGNLGLYIYGMTPNGVRVYFMKSHGLTCTKKYIEHRFDPMTGDREEVTLDRGAEIFLWLVKHPDVESFVILDDEDEDIINYFTKEFIKTSYAMGLTKENVEKAISILNGD